MKKSVNQIFNHAWYCFKYFPVMELPHYRPTSSFAAQVFIPQRQISSLTNHSESRSLEEIASDPSEINRTKYKNVLQESSIKDLSDVGPNLKPTFNFAAYINQSPTLQNLVKLGVNLSSIERKENVGYIIGLNFEKDVKRYITFLHDHGVPSDKIGEFITKNPYIFKESLEDLEVRINYLKSKKFSSQMISRIVCSNPHWLSHSVEDIDSRLGHFQRSFQLTGDQVRLLADKSPKLITTKMSHIKLVTFVVKEEMGFSDAEVKGLLLKTPKLFRMSQNSLLSRFEYAHKEMKLSHEQILLQPVVLFTRVFIIKQRHMFLQSLGRAQYNPKMPGYVSMLQLVSGTDAEFCENVAKTTVHTYNLFLKTQ